MPHVPASAPYREQPWFIIQQASALQQFHPAFTTITTDEWLSLFVHEYFHMTSQLPHARVAGMLERAQHPEQFVDQEDLKKLYRENPQLQTLLAQEHRLLSQALRQQPLSCVAAQQALKQWKSLYQQRIQTFSAHFNQRYIEWDAFWTFLEGTARYVESRFLLDRQWQPDPTLLPDPHFSAFKATQGKSYAALPPANRSIAEHYFYAIGMHLAFLLDVLEPDWPMQVFQQEHWLITLVEQGVAQPCPTVTR